MSTVTSNVINTTKETKRGRFLRLGNRRLEDALDSIRLIENLLQNPYAYDYSNEDIDVLMKKLNNATYRLSLYRRENKIEHH